jgi:myo-inositol-1(or 4)-monophosphatase
MSKFFYYNDLIERKIMAIEWIEILKKAATLAYENVHSLLGTKEGAENEGKKGAGGDITTKIDLIAEKCVIDRLTKENIEVHLVSEYFGDKNNYQKCNDYIIMDPVDGSLNANRGIPYCCISIAHANGPNTINIMEGVILNLYTKDIYWAIKGKGAYFNDDPISVSKLDDIDRAVMGVALNDSEPLSRTVQRCKPLIDEVYKIRVMGSIALELCEIADGSFDFFMDIRGTVRIVDIAASIIIIQEAGGDIFSSEGVSLNLPLTIKSKTTIIASNPYLTDDIKKRLPELNQD